MKIYLLIMSALSLSLYSMEQELVDIADLRKAEVLRVLLSNARDTPWTSPTIPKEVPVEMCAVELSKYNNKIAFFNMRLIKVDFSDDKIDVRSYNCANGAGTAQRAIATLRQSKL